MHLYPSPNCPFLLLPQQKTEPLSIIAQLCESSLNPSATLTEIALLGNEETICGLPCSYPVAQSSLEAGGSPAGKNRPQHATDISSNKTQY